MVALKRGPAGPGGPSLRRKQERRGGIGTPQDRGQAVSPSRKQERRGGIETNSTPDGGMRTSAKQERRGGIETPLDEEGIPFLIHEAGTPWWH